MKFTITTWAVVAASLLLVACGGGGGNAGSVNTNPTRGELMQNPPVRTASLGAAEFSGELQAAGTSGQLLLQLATGSGTGTLPCGVDVQYIKYGTVGAKGEATQASGALMVPTGSGVGCSGARPIVVFAHGTSIEKRYNIADLVDSTNPAYQEATVVASQFAAKGFIVVAPNYAGYDSSTLGYHPFLVADQQSKEMIDAVTAARSALPRLLAPVSDNGKLFITGISQGGFVTMATHRAMQNASMTVTASSPIEPVSAVAAYADFIMAGHVPAGGTYLIPMLLTGYQKSYGTLYSTPTELYEPTYAAGIEAAFPGAYTSTTAVSSGIVPQSHLFTGTAPTDTDPAVWPLWANGFGAGNLITTAARTTYLTAIAATGGADQGFAPAAVPGHPLRTALALNDMRTWTTPARPMLLCAGSGDPTVFYGANAGLSSNLLAANPYVKILDLENAYPSYVGANQLTGGSVPLLQGGFAAAKAATAAAAGSDPVAQATAVTAAYHGVLAPPFCMAAASGFFAAL
jgi:Prolyl oligopeptidase family